MLDQSGAFASAESADCEGNGKVGFPVTGEALTHCKRHPFHISLFHAETAVGVHVYLSAVTPRTVKTAGPSDGKKTM
jgi:hypothetical protein